MCTQNKDLETHSKNPGAYAPSVNKGKTEDKNRKK